MRWTQQQRDAVRDAFWKTGSADCPIHGRPLDELRAVSAQRAERQAVRAGCKACGETHEVTPDTDPIHVRVWTEEDRAALLGVKRGAVIRCPVDGTMLLTSHRSGLGSSMASHTASLFYCGRCGNRFLAP